MSALKPITRRSSKFIENYEEDSIIIEKAIVKPEIKPKSSVCFTNESNRVTFFENQNNENSDLKVIHQNTKLLPKSIHEATILEEEFLSDYSDS